MEIRLRDSHPMELRLKQALEHPDDLVLGNTCPGAQDIVNPSHVRLGPIQLRVNWPSAVEHRQWVIFPHPISANKARADELEGLSGGRGGADLSGGVNPSPKVRWCAPTGSNSGMQLDLVAFRIVHAAAMNTAFIR